jgi:hypothetical protein
MVIVTTSSPVVRQATGLVRTRSVLARLGCDLGRGVGLRPKINIGALFVPGGISDAILRGAAIQSPKWTALIVKRHLLFESVVVVSAPYHLAG